MLVVVVVVVVVVLVLVLVVVVREVSVERGFVFVNAQLTQCV